MRTKITLEAKCTPVSNNTARRKHNCAPAYLKVRVLKLFGWRHHPPVHKGYILLSLIHQFISLS